jgi:hypothetical protein
VPNRDVALALARMGFAVFPCKGETGTDDDDAKRPVPGMFWRKLSSTDPAQIGKWWDKWPGSMPALDLAKSKLLVVDLDLPKKAGEGNGIDWFAPVAAGHGFDLEHSPHTVTLRGGWHLFFRQPEGPPLGNARGTLPPKTEANVDVRGNGGYVIAPGASLPDGRTYQARGSLSDAPVAPDWLTAILRGESGKRLDATPVATPTAAVHLNGAGTGDRFFRAVNDLALANLGRWVPAVFGSAARHHASTGAYRVSSKALGRQLEEDLSLAPTGIIDFGVHDMGDARQGRRTAIDVAMEHGEQKDAKAAALWLCERLGRDPVSLGFDVGGDAALGAAVARNLVERDGVTIDADTGELIETVAPDAPPPVALAPPVPGLVGEIAAWITASARMPQPILALGAALVVVGTAIGRDIAGPTLSATHLYVIGLAPTGSGKDHNLQQCGALLKAAGMGHHLGPSEFISMTSIINVLKRTPLALCVQDEFGAFLKRVNARKANNFEGATLKILRTMWGSSFKPMMTPEWANIMAVEIDSPAISIFGASTEEEFYAALEGLDKDNGVLNRFMILASSVRPPERDPLVDPLEVPAGIRDKLVQLYSRSGVLAAAQRNAPHLDVRPVALAWGADQAKELYGTLRDEVQERSDADVIARPFLARVVETAIRVATIIAAGRFSPTVDYDDMAVGRDLALQSSEAMIRGAKDHMAETETEASHNRIVRAIKASGGKLSKRDLLRTMRHLKARELDELIKSMIASETIFEIRKEMTTAGGKPGFFYALAG